MVWILPDILEIYRTESAHTSIWAQGHLPLCFPPALMHFWLLNARFNFAISEWGSTVPRNMDLYYVEGIATIASAKHHTISIHAPGSFQHSQKVMLDPHTGSSTRRARRYDPYSWSNRRTPVGLSSQSKCDLPCSAYSNETTSDMLVGWRRESRVCALDNQRAYNQKLHPRDVTRTRLT